MKVLVIVAMLPLFLTACASQQSLQGAQQPLQSKPATPSDTQIVAPVLREDLFQPVQNLPTISQILALPSQQQIDMRRIARSSARNQKSPNRELVQYLKNQLPGFEYRAETLTISQALEQQAGNCMSLAALTVALADAAGVEADFQMVRTPPLFDRTTDTLISSDHVRVRLFYPDGANGNSMRRSHLLVDYFSDQRGRADRSASRQEFHAMLYRNLAAEALLDGDLDRSFALAKESLQFLPDYAEALNILAVLHRRGGDSFTAEALYRYALDVNGDSLDLISNYQALLSAQGRDAEVEQLELRIANLPDHNPFHHIELAERARLNGDLQAALRHLSITIERTPYLHEAYWRKAMVLDQLGQHQRSTQLMSQAVERAQRQQVRTSYKNKLYSMKAQQHSL